MASKSAQRGSTTEQARRHVPQRLRPLEALMERAITGQMLQPPETAIAVPLQQAVSHLQQPGGLAGRLNAPSGPGTGLQTRAQLGLPDRKSYFPGVPSFDAAAALGAFPPIMGETHAMKTAKKEGVGPKNKKQRAEQASPELKGQR